MAVRTITAEINGTQRTIRADIPDGAGPEEISSAVEEWASAQPKIPGMEKLGGILPGLPPSRIPEALQGPPIMSKGVANYPPRNALEGFADKITFGGTRKLREGIEEFNPPTDESPSNEQRFRGTRHVLEGTMQAMTPLALGSALRTIGAAPNVIRGVLAAAKPYLAGGAVGAGVDVGSQILGAGPEAGALAGEVAGAATGVGSGALRKQELSGNRLPALSWPVRAFLKMKGLGKVATVYDALAATGGKAEAGAPTPFQPSEVTRRSMGKFSPYEAPEISAQPGRAIPRKGFVPPEAPAEAPPKAPEPFRANPRIAQKMRYGGSTSEYSGPSYKRVGGKKSAPVAEGEGEAGAGEAGGGDLESGLSALPQEYRNGAVATAKKIAGSRQAKVGKVVDLMRNTGISAELADNATPAQRKTIAEQAGFKDMSDETWNHVLMELRKPSAVPPMPPTRFEK